jgi:hypothetical protein
MSHVKKIAEQSLIGQRGINLIEKRVLGLGFIWHPTGGLEAGIDGWIELRDSATGEMIGGQILVQSKATEAEFQGESDSSFEYLCAEKDLNYWLAGSAPVALVCSRPTTDEAYWVSIKEYFRDPARRKARKVLFDKKRDRLDGSARDVLLGIAGPPDGGAYFAPLPRDEVLFSNLLRVSALPKRLHIAETDFRSGRDIVEYLTDARVPRQSEWVLKNKRILSVYDLREEPWKSICDQGSVDDFGTDEWADSDDPDKRRDFVRLLNECLRASLRRLAIAYRKDLDLYFYTATPTLKDRRVAFHSIARRSGRIVFHAYMHKQDPTSVAYYRHNAFQGRFRRFDARWYLQVTPTYFFTVDGRTLHPFYESKLKGIKALERNSAVLGQVAMWADILGERRGDLFTSSYPHLRFGELVRLKLNAGVDDKAWLTTEEDAATKSAGAETIELPLFRDGAGE